MGKKFNGKRIFVTGGAGFIGSNLVRRLLSEGAEVHILVKETTNLWRISDFRDRIVLHTGDLADFSLIENILLSVLPDGVFHLGASMMIHGIVLEPEKVMKVNYGGTKNIIESIGKNCFFVNTGSYSDGVGADDFAFSKRKSTEFCAEFGKKNKRPISTLRLFTPYGPFIQKERFVYKVLTNSVSGKPISISAPDITRDFIFVDDLVDLYFVAAEKSYEYCGEVFNAGSGVSVTLKDAVTVALEISGRKSEILWKNSPRLSYDFENVCADIKKNQMLLNWKPKTSLREGFLKTHDWLKENQHRY